MKVLGEIYYKNINADNKTSMEYGQRRIGIEWDKEIIFHSVLPNILFITKRARSDIDPKLACLYTSVTKSNKYE